MKLFLRFSVISLLLLSGSVSLAAKLYWVGGSGKFNDPAHWSYESGGPGGAKTPSALDDVYFDENSFPYTSYIDLIGTAQVHDLVFSKYTNKVILSGLQNEQIIVGGQIKLNAYIDNQFMGTIKLISNEPSTPVNFSLAKVKGKLILEGNTNWVIDGRLVGDAGSSFHLSQGTFNLQNADLHADQIIASPGVTINLNKSTLYAPVKLVLPTGINFNDAGNSRILASKKDPNKYQVASDIIFSPSTRFGNTGSVMTCAVVNTDNTNPTCAGGCDGTMVFTVPAACTSNPVYAVWNTGFGCTVIPTGTITPGTTYSVTGICGCGTLYGVTFTNDPNTLDSTYANFNIPIADPIPQRVKTFTKVSPTCFGYCDGMVIATLDVFGNNPFVLTWTLPGGGTLTHTVTNYNGKDTVFNACAGTYSVNIVDSNGCISPQTYTTTLTEPTQVVGTPSTTSLTCNAVCTGGITNATSGGTGALSCTLNGAPMPGCTAANLCAGVYTVITNDANMCADTDIVTIAQPPPIIFTKNPLSGTIAIACNNTCNGSVGVTAVGGGTPGYTYAWTPVGGSVSSGATSSTYSNLCGSVAGTTYTCTITDANTCTTTATFTVTSPPALSNTITATQPKCVAGQGSSVGSATVTQSGGIAPYTFTWSPSGGTVGGSSPTSTYTMSPGTYTVISQDANLCFDTTTVTITPPPALSGTMTTVTDPTCPNLNNGQLCVTASGGTGAYSYTWTPSAGTGSCTPATLTVSPGGFVSYTVTVTDANTCTVTVNDTIFAPPVATINAAITHPTCSGTCNGSATLTPTGGTGPFTYQWSCSASVTNTISGQCGNTTCNYTVTDAATACTYTGAVSFTVAPTVTVAIATNTLTCFGDCSATITTTVTGGTPGYSYSWTGTGTNPVCVTCPGQVNMCAGNYTCQVTDNQGCVQTATIAVVGPPAMSNTVSVTNPVCIVGQGTSVGSATVTESGGTGPYVFSWSPAGGTTGCATPSSCYSNIPAGTYTVIITDSKGCQDTATATLNPPTPVTGTITTVIDPTCPNLNNGQLCVTASGGNGVYTYTWSPIGGNGACSAATLTVPPGGTSVYTVTISDGNGCTTTVSGTITAPPTATVSSAITNAACGSNPCTASATLTPSGGVGPFTYQWSCSGSTLDNISGQCPNTTCNYTVTDAGTNCRYTGSVSFGPVPSTMSVSISATSLACAGDCNSVITSTVNGGTPGYTYSWTGTGANPVCTTCPTQTAMCAGNYTCQVTDSLGCIQSATLAITSPPSLTITMVPTQPTCSLSCDGSILATVSGGTSPYPGVSWSPSIAPNSPTTLNPIGLCGSAAPGTTYTLIITDNNGCQDTATATLIAPPSLTVTVAVDSALCRGMCNGTATATASGGTPGYTYSWDNGAFTASSTASGLCAGQHTLSVRDTNNCLATTQFFDIFEPNQLTATVINIVNTCGPCTGSADANPAGGTPNYTYTWSPTGGNGSSATGLCIGPYTLTVSDANGCGPVTATFTVSPIVSISITAISQSVSCAGSCDGIASATASSGTAPYNMVWTSSPSGAVVTTCPSVTSCTATSLCTGTFVITATDQNGCINSDSLVIGTPPPLTATVSTTNTTCFGTCAGSSTVTAAGGQAPYTVIYSTGTSGAIDNNLCPGPYTYTVIDNRGCTVVQTFTITSNSQLTYTSTSTTPVACAGSDGSIEVTASGGSPAYTFTWNPTAGGTVTTVSPTSTLTGIPAGVYSVTIVDINGCDTTVQITLSDPGSATVTPVVTPESCFGACDGSATVTAVGSPVITLTWPGGTPTGPSPIVATNLCAASSPYAVQAVDGNGCVSFTNVTITGPTAITFTPTTITQPNCASGGTICVTAGGGSGSGYTYTWSPSGGNASCANGIAAGNYTLAVTDGAGCTDSTSFTLTPTSTPTVVVTPVNTTCSYLLNGSASASVNGGIPTYTYTWSSAGSGVISSGPNVTNVGSLPPDSYTVSVTDAGGCTTQQTFTINLATDIVANITKTDNLCNQGCTGTASVTPSGGTGAYTYNWSPSTGVVNSTATTSTYTDVCPGNYTLVVTDGNNCTDTTSFTIIQPAPVTFTTASTNPTCSLSCNGSATVTPSGGTGTTYTVGWSPNICINCPVATNLCDDTYTITVCDTNGCCTSQTLIITDPPGILPNVTVSQPVCVGDVNGSLTSNPSGGTGSSYTFTWTTAGTVVSTATSSTNSGVGAGTYTLIVNDSLGCADTTTHTITPPPTLTLTASSTPASCGQSNGSIIITGTSGSGTVTVNWLNPASCGSSLICNNLGFGVYNVELTDQNGCRDTFNVAVNNPNGPLVDSLVTHSNCNATCNGIITVWVTSGVNQTTPYSFTWTPSSPGTIVNTFDSTTFSGLCAANSPFIMTVLDSVGCGTAVTFTLGEPPAIQDNGNFVNATCLGINDGSITSVASGGTPGTTGYSYTLDGTTTNTTGIFIGLAVGIHTVCISDSVSCQVCFTYTISPNMQIFSSVSSTDVNCFGDCNGSATLSNVNGGTAPYVISWNDPNAQSGVIAINLCAGSYTATITDTNGCMALQPVTITQPGQLTISAVSTSPACGVCDGTVTITPSGGTPSTLTGYVYNWSTGATTSSIDSVCAGLYQVDVMDSLGCKQSFQLPISNTNAPTLTVTSTSPICTNLCTGSATVVASGGATPYTYSWLPGGQSGTSISSQCAGLYFVQVLDSLGCIATDSALISTGTVLSVSSTMTNPPCNDTTGMIIASVSGGSGNYSFNWMPGGSTNDTLANIPAGNYTLTVTDNSNGCQDTSIIGLNNNSNGPILAFVTSDVLCNGDCNGTATVTASGGNPGYTYQWSTGANDTNAVVTGLCASTQPYAILVTDAIGCIQTGQITISQPNALIASVPVITQPGCTGDCNGVINAIISGGTPIYTYAWSPASITGSFGDSLCAGNYSVTVTDANGCTVTEFDTLVDPPVLVLTGTVVPASCSNSPDGAINTTTTGGTPGLVAPGYTWQWSGGSTATSANLSNIPIGNYTVVVTDSKNCTDTVPFTVISTITITVNAGNDTNACAIGSVVLNGTVSPGTTVQWMQLPNPPGTIVGSTPTVTVNPALGTTQYVLIGQNGTCTMSDTVNIVSDTLPIPDAGTSASVFIGYTVALGGAPTNPSGGTIYWSPGSGMTDSTVANPVVTPSVTTTYTVYETNSNGCVGMDTITITVLPEFVIPNGFSPNGDGYNDVWQIDMIYLFPDCEVEVFNRWGEPLFYSKGYNVPWNGTFKGKPVPVGTYYYLIKLHDKEGKFPDHYTGPLTILR